MTLRCKICSDNNIDVCWPTIYDKKINLYYCNNCNHGFLNPYFTKDELENFYKKDYRKIFFFNIPFKNTKKSVEKMSIDTGQLKESEDRAKFIVSNVKDKSHVVDIGSGIGMFLDCCYDVNNSLILYGVEFDEEHKDLTKNSDKIKILKNFKELEELKIFFNIVTIFHTFEHIENLKEFLFNLKKIINNDSIIYIEVPNGEFNWKKKSFVHLAHPQIFSTYSITKVLNLSGYEIMSYEKYNKSENYIIVKAKLANKELKQFLKLDNKKILKDRIANAKWNLFDKSLELVKKTLLTFVPPKYLGLISRIRYKINK